MTRKLRTGLLISVAGAAFVAWVAIYNLYPPKPRLPHWLKTPDDAEVLVLRRQRGSPAAGRGEVFARIVYTGQPADVVDSLMNACKANGYSPNWEAAKPAKVADEQRKDHQARLKWLGADYLPPSAGALFVSAPHAFADQTGILVFAWPKEKSNPQDKDKTIVDLFFTGAY